MVYSVKQISEKVKLALSGCREVIAALLMGSCSRGEETYFLNKSGEKELLSDYEMLIIVKDNYSNDESNRKLQALADELKSHSTSPCFELEWSYKTVREMKKLDKRFIFFEAKASSYVICGDNDVMNLFPNINIKNLNYCELNTVLIHRLYHVVRDYLIPDEHYQKYLIARNTLDIPTAILPLLGVLQSSYKNRNNVFKKYIFDCDASEELISRLDDYLQMKKDYDAKQYERYTIGEMRTYFIEDIKFLYQFQKKVQKGHTFRNNYRLLLSGIYRHNFGLIRMSIYWERLNETLYNRMLNMLEVGDITEEKLKTLENDMYKIYGYK